MQAQFDTALADHLPNLNSPIGLAVSGGGDSMALLKFAANWAKRSGQPLIGLTVDHRLRPEAADEAAYVAETCAHHAIPHETIIWETPQKSQARARRARHALLASALKAAGGHVLLTGHTADDQLENYLIRKASKSGDYGLAGMQTVAVSPVWPEGAGVFLMRPLLNMRRANLRAWLTGQQASWREDPSNEDTSYERVRARRRIAETPGLADEISSIQSNLGEKRAQTDVKIADWLAKAAINEDQLHIPLPPSNMAIEALSTAIGLLAMASSGSERPARSARRLSVATALTERNMSKTSLGGTVFAVSNNTLKLNRETNRPPLSYPINAEGRLETFVYALRGTICA